MEFIEIVLMFGGMGLGFAALYEIAQIGRAHV